jgi:NADPH:quinone reductase-like Zn-dependent oxidoreductase
VLEATGGRGADLAINTVGGTVFPGVHAFARLRRGASRSSGTSDGVLKARSTLDALHAKRPLRVFGVSNKLRNAEQRAGQRARLRPPDVLPAIAEGGSARSSSARCVRRAPRRQRSGWSRTGTSGKLVLVMP